MKNRFIQALLILSVITVVFVFSCKKDKDEPDSIAANLYFTSYVGDSVNKIDLVNNPNTVTNLVNTADGIDTPAGIALTDDGYLIVTEEDGNRILKMQKNGTGDVVVLYDINDGISTPTAITIDNATGTIYWCNSGTGQVMKGSDDGLSSPAALYGGQVTIDYAYGIAIDKIHNKLYTSDFSLHIQVGSLDGSGDMEILYDNDKFNEMVSPSNIFVDPDHNKIYWSDESADQVVEANLDGTGTPLVLFDQNDGVDRADGVFVDYNAKKIYWSETNSNVIARGNLDGTGTREVLVDNVQSYGLVLEF